jgi:hypothetical protein
LYSIDKSISFKNNCSISYNQNQADTLYAHIIRVIAILEEFSPNEYWAIGGTLLGRERFGVNLPWDDDFDFAVTMKGYFALLENIVKIKQKSGYEFVEDIIGLKVYYGDDTHALGDIFVCDFIDKENMVYSGPVIDGKSLFIIHTYILNQICFPYQHVFPLVKRRFGDTIVNCPSDTERILHNNYSGDVISCIIPPISNKTHVWLSKKCIIEMLNQMKTNHRNCPESVKLFSVAFGAMMNANMSAFVNAKPFTNESIDFLDLLYENIQGRPVANAIRAFFEHIEWHPIMNCVPDLVNHLLSS